MTRRLTVLLLFAAAACTEESTAPGTCPNFCPGGEIGIADTILTDVIVRDSAFRGYIQPYQSEQMAVADIPSVVDSRAIWLHGAMFTRVIPNPDDTATVPITVDSSRLRINIIRRDTATTNLVIRLYRLPLTIDSTTTFDALASDFAATPVDTVNVSDLLARPPIGDTATIRIWGDSIRTDSAGHTLQFAADSSLLLYFDFDTLQVPFVAADSGKLAWGMRITADTLASIALGANDAVDRDPFIRWFYHYTKPDTLPAPDSVVTTTAQREVTFDSFVFDPPNPALDDNLTVGGAPSARSLLRVALPAFLHDSIDVVRATVILVPVAAVAGVPPDSFSILARPVLSDLGAKSPLSNRLPLYGRATVRIGSTDTVRIELTDLVRTWSRDTSIVTAFMLGQLPEGGSYTEARFYSSRGLFKPALHVTYVKRFPFGTP